MQGYLNTVSSILSTKQWPDVHTYRVFGRVPGLDAGCYHLGDMITKFGIGALVALIRRPSRQNDLNQSLADA